MTTRQRTATPRVGIVTVADDLHALAVRESLSLSHGIDCYIIESNRISQSDSLVWFNEDALADQSTVRTRAGTAIRVQDLDAVWWRRVGASQVLPNALVDEGQVDLINNDCRSALLGSFLTEFRGTWISHPLATTRAENKLLQLRTAARVGLNVPNTLVSQNPAEIRRFCSKLDNRVVVKPVLGTGKVPILTTNVREEHMLSDDGMRLCPAIYQERVEGQIHLRVCCFGDRIYAVLLRSPALDWRPNLDISAEVFDLSEELTQKLRHCLQVLELKMGIFDLKLLPDGSTRWLEVNPQGQFLFLEGLSGVQLTSAFAEFLHEEAWRSYWRRDDSATGPDAEKVGEL